MATLTLKDHFREVKRGRPGHRFQSYHRRAKEDRQSGAGKGRLLRLALAIGCMLVGVVLVFIPGPAILFFFFGGALLAAESLIIAKGMDWLEVRLRAVWRWGKIRWDALPPAGKIALAVVAVALGAAALWFGWKLFAG